MISYERALEIAEKFATYISNKYVNTIIAVLAVGSLGSDYYRPGQSDIDTVVIIKGTREDALHIENQIRPIADSYQQNTMCPKVLVLLLCAKNSCIRHIFQVKNWFWKF